MVSEPNDNKAAIAKAYIREMLEMNPMWQSETILRRRQELWSGDSRPAAGAPNTAAGRTASAARSPSSPAEEQADRRREERARRYLEILQSQFYQLPEEKLHQYIQFLLSDRLPEFTATAKRLENVAQHRQALLVIGKTNSDEKFVYSLLHCLVCPAAQAGSLREQYIESIIAERRVKPSCRMVRKFVAQHPAIYELERDWFDLFLDSSNQKQWTAQYSLRGRYQSVTQTRLAKMLAVAAIVSAMIIAPLLVSDKNDRPNRNQRIRSTPKFKLSPSPNPTTADAIKDRLEAIRSTNIDTGSPNRPGQRPSGFPDQMPSGLPGDPTSLFPPTPTAGRNPATNDVPSFDVPSFDIPSFDIPSRPIPSHEDLMRQLLERPTPIVPRLPSLRSRIPRPQSTPPSIRRSPSLTPPSVSPPTYSLPPYSPGSNR